MTYWKFTHNFYQCLHVLGKMKQLPKKFPRSMPDWEQNVPNHFLELTACTMHSFDSNRLWFGWEKDFRSSTKKSELFLQLPKARQRQSSWAAFRYTIGPFQADNQFRLQFFAHEEKRKTGISSQSGISCAFVAGPFIFIAMKLSIKMPEFLCETYDSLSNCRFYFLQRCTIHIVGLYIILHLQTGMQNI